MMRWCGTDWGGQPDDERPGVLASFGGDAIVEVDLEVVADDDQEEDECEER